MRFQISISIMGEHIYDTGLKLETLQKSVLVALDIFGKI